MKKQARLKVKVCGMRDAENIRQVEALCPDWLGLIFWPKSSRYVSQRPEYLPTTAKRVGVFVDQDIDEVKHIATDYALDFIQLHGKESPEYASQLYQWKIIKAFNIATAEDLEQTRAYEGIVDYFLFDTKGKVVGGNGEKFDWRVLQHYDGKTPFLLSGGIGPDDAERILKFHHPRCIGIDLNSRFEISPAFKDAYKLSIFINKIRNNEQDQ